MNRRFAQLLALAPFAVIVAFAQPVIGSLGAVNAASYRTPGLPGSGIAQGSYRPAARPARIRFWGGIW